jgi:PAS domain S-box-containing protein
LAVIDYDGVLPIVNPSCCQIYDYRQDRLLDRPFTLLFSPAQHKRVMALHRDFLDHSADMDGERVVLRRDGAKLNVIAPSVRVPGEEGRWRRLVYVDHGCHMLLWSPKATHAASREAPSEVTGRKKGKLEFAIDGYQLRISGLR